MRPTKEEIERFWSKVDKRRDEECWLWLGGKKNKEGYGGFWLSELNNTVGCHKLMFIIVHNFDWEDIPDTIVVRHVCNNYLCINPKHLKLGTYKDNSQDMINAGNSLKGVKNPKYHHLTKDVVNIIRNKFSKGINPRDLAKEYDLGYGYIISLVRNRVYKDESYLVPNINYSIKFDDEIIEKIKKMKQEGCPVKEITKKFDISQSQVYNILRGDQRKNVTKP